MYIEQNRRDWIGNELCQWLGWGRAWHLVESCCGGKRTFNEEPTDHWTTAASVHRLQADTGRAGTHFCQPLADPTVPSNIETGKIVKSSKDTPSGIFVPVWAAVLCKSTLSRCPHYQPHIWPISLDWLPGRHRPAGTTAGQCFHARQG